MPALHDGKQGGAQIHHQPCHANRLQSIEQGRHDAEGREGKETVGLRLHGHRLGRGQRCLHGLALQLQQGAQGSVVGAQQQLALQVQDVHDGKLVVLHQGLDLALQQLAALRVRAPPREPVAQRCGEQAVLRQGAGIGHAAAAPAGDVAGLVLAHDAQARLDLVTVLQGALLIRLAQRVQSQQCQTQHQQPVRDFLPGRGGFAPKVSHERKCCLLYQFA